MLFYNSVGFNAAFFIATQIGQLMRGTQIKAIIENLYADLGFFNANLVIRYVTMPASIPASYDSILQGFLKDTTSGLRVLFQKGSSALTLSVWVEFSDMIQMWKEYNCAIKFSETRFAAASSALLEPTKQVQLKRSI